MAGAAANLPKWQKIFLHFSCLTTPITYGRTVAHKGEKTMLNDFDDVNRILAGMRDDGIVEPIDDPNIQVDFWDWADIVGVVDDFAPVDF